MKVFYAVQKNHVETWRIRRHCEWLSLRSSVITFVGGGFFFFLGGGGGVGGWESRGFGNVNLVLTENEVKKGGWLGDGFKRFSHESPFGPTPAERRQASGSLHCGSGRSILPMSYATLGPSILDRPGPPRRLFIYMCMRIFPPPPQTRWTRRKFPNSEQNNETEFGPDKSVRGLTQQQTIFYQLYYQHFVKRNSKLKSEWNETGVFIPADSVNVFTDHKPVESE